MTSHDDRVYLQHVIDSINNVENFTEGILDSFHENTGLVCNHSGFTNYG